MSARQSIRINLMASWASHAVGILIGVFLMPFVLGTLGDETYGTWIFVNSIAGYSGFLYLGFGKTCCRYVAEAHARRDWTQLNQIVTVILAVFAAMGSLALLAGGMLAWLAPSLHDWGDHSPLEIQLVILILGMNVAIGLVGSVFGGVLTGTQRFDIDRGLNVVGGLVRLLLTVIFLQSEWGLLTLALIYLTVTIFEFLGHVFFAFREVETLSIGLGHLNRQTFRTCASFSSFACVELVSNQVLEFTDPVIIGVVFGAKAVVPYYIATRLCRFISRPIMQIGGVFMPRAGELQANNASTQLQELLLQGVGLALLLTLGFFIGAGFFGDMLIETWLGPGYSQSYLLLLLLLGTEIVTTPAEVVRSVLFGMGHIRVPSLILLLAAVANVVLTLLLIRPLGLIGVALGTLIPRVVIELGLLLPYAIRALRLDFGRLVRDALAPQLLPLSVLTAYCYAVTAAISPSVGWTPIIAVSLGGGLVLAIGWLGNFLLSKHFGLWTAARSSMQGR